MVVFDETLYRLVPRLYTMVDTLLPGPRSPRERELERSAAPAFLRFGSWIGSDRDGHPLVTSSVTEEAIRIQADHVLRGHEAVATRLSQTLAAKIRGDAVPRALAHRLVADALAMPQLASSLADRYPDEPFRQRLGFVAERLRHTRVRLLGERRGATTAGFASPEEVLAELEEVQQALVDVGLARSAWGDVQDLVWQIQTFGFHLASLEVRQHAAVHRRVLAGSETGQQPGRDEVLETFRSMARIQSQVGPAAAVGLELDVVPLLESSAALEGAGELLADLVADPAYREHLASRGGRQEVMLGYSDSTKELGYVASNWLLHRAPRHRADALPRPRRRHRAGRRPAGARRLRAAAGLGPGPAQAHRAGRGHLDPLR
jgi:phosphoenolpyruvate carboxylase